MLEPKEQIKKKANGAHTIVQALQSASAHFWFCQPSTTPNIHDMSMTSTACANECTLHAFTLTAMLLIVCMHAIYGNTQPSASTQTISVTQCESHKTPEASWPSHPLTPGEGAVPVSCQGWLSTARRSC